MTNLSLGTAPALITVCPNLTLPVVGSPRAISNVGNGLVLLRDKIYADGKRQKNGDNHGNKDAGNFLFGLHVIRRFRGLYRRHYSGIGIYT